MSGFTFLDLFCYFLFLKMLEFFHLEGSWEFDSVKLWYCVSSVTDELVFHFYLFLYLLLTCSGWKCVSWHGGVCTSAVSSLYLRLCWKSSWGPGGRLCCTSCSGAVGHYKRNRDKDKSKWLTGWGCYTCTLIFFSIWWPVCPAPVSKRTTMWLCPKPHLLFRQ